MDNVTASTSLPKLAGADLSTVIERCGMSAEARVCVRETNETSEAIRRLIEKGFVMEAAGCFAHALPKREAVWWAAMCAIHTAPPGLGEADRLAREAAEIWVRRQTEEARRQAMAHAERAGFQTPEAWAGVAAFWSGPTLGAIDALAVPPAPHLAGLAVAGAVALAAVRDAPERRAMRLAQFIESARAIAHGGAGRLEPEAGTLPDQHSSLG
jgi:hypothetical protein